MHIICIISRFSSHSFSPCIFVFTSFVSFHYTLSFCSFGTLVINYTSVHWPGSVPPLVPRCAYFNKIAERVVVLPCSGTPALSCRLLTCVVEGLSPIMPCKYKCAVLFCEHRHLTSLQNLSLRTATKGNLVDDNNDVRLVFH
jgi:hypothetical protein